MNGPRRSDGPSSRTSCSSSPAMAWAHRRLAASRRPEEQDAGGARHAAEPGPMPLGPDDQVLDLLPDVRVAGDVPELERSLGHGRRRLGQARGLLRRQGRQRRTPRAAGPRSPGTRRPARAPSHGRRRPGDVPGRRDAGPPRGSRRSARPARTASSRSPWTARRSSCGRTIPSAPSRAATRPRTPPAPPRTRSILRRTGRPSGSNSPSSSSSSESEYSNSRSASGRMAPIQWARCAFSARVAAHSLLPLNLLDPACSRARRRTA